MIDNQDLNNRIIAIEAHLKNALQSAQQLQTDVQKVEGDSDLFRKLSFYLVPNINHWVEGMQAGNIKDLKQLLNERINPPKPEKKKKK